jgi:predicted outer membrane repeat protein
MARITISIGFALLMVFGLVIWLSPNPILAAEVPKQTPDAVLNSEGDEWVEVDYQQTAPAPPAPELVSQNESDQLPLELQAAVLPGPEAALGLALDEARQEGPEAVLAFVANQPNPSLPLLVAAAWDAQNEINVGLPPAPGDPNAPNWVAVNNGPCAYSSIQAAINAVPSGTTLLAASGIYIESFDVSGSKVLTIIGGYDATCSNPIAGAITEIQASAAGSVVDVTSSSKLTLRNLDLSGGTSFGAGVDVLGSSKVTLDNTDVHNNTGSSGGGFYIGSGSIITYTNDADIYNNTASAGGGAIVYGNLYGFQTVSDIYQNSSTTDGGGIYVSGGTVVLDNADVVANTATEDGGGIYIVNGTLRLSNSVFVGETSPCCQSAVNGGGIYASGSQIYLSGSETTVMNNTATGNGGGLYLVNGTILNVNGCRVGHTATTLGGNDAVLGAGMYVDGGQVTINGKINNNIATNSGGGIYATNSSLTMTLTTVGGIGTNEHNQIGATGLNGAGMYLINNTIARLDQTNIISNTMSNINTGYGGGIYIRDGSVLTMTNSTVDKHKVPSLADGRGAGMYIYNATVTMSNTVVADNIAANFAGGVRMFGTSVLNILGGSQFNNNQALNGNGGAIAATNTPDLNIEDSKFQTNHASGSGGAVYLDAGTISFDGAWSVVENLAGQNGGALSIMGSGDASFHATKGPGASLISNNHANGHGGAIYHGNTSNLELYATSGYRLAIQGNTADLDGGAANASAGGLFDIYGDVNLSNNSADGNGGAIYLSGGSKVWLDDYFSTLPTVFSNSATNGGAIYALNSTRVECDGVQFGDDGVGNSATAGSGGAVYINTSTFSADNCVFKSNQAVGGNGGAVAAVDSTVNLIATYNPPVTQQVALVERGTPNAPQSTACDPFKRDCSRMFLNTASGDGGALYSSNSNVTVEETIFDQNTANRGGAIFQEGASAVGEIANVLAVKNTSIQAFGAGIRAANGTITIRHATLAHNIGGAGFSPGSVVANVYNTIIWGNTVAAFGNLTITECNIDQGGTAGPAYDPLFLSPIGGAFRPGFRSPAIDACATGLAIDLMGTSRPIGTLYDIGAYEGSRPLFLPMIQR